MTVSSSACQKTVVVYYYLLHYAAKLQIQLVQRINPTAKKKPPTLLKLENKIHSRRVTLLRFTFLLWVIHVAPSVYRGNPI